MRLLNRKDVFNDFKNISSIIQEFQKSFFDEDDAENEIFDAINLKTKNIHKEYFDLMIKHHDINSYSTKLSEQLKNLLKHYNCEELILISHLKIDFFSERGYHEDERVLNAFNLLSQFVNSNSFKEAIQIDLSELHSFIDIFFWVEKFNASPEYVFWFDSNEKFCFYLCKYGNIHLINFEKDLMNGKELEKLGFIVNEDYEQF